MSEQLKDCIKLTGSFDDTNIVGEITIVSLLDNPFEKHIGSFEIPLELKNLMSIDEFNACIDWYLKWKIREPLETQNTCTIKKVFGTIDGDRMIIAINLYKYLRNKGYDISVIEKFIK